jgi:hypothetical protein
LRSHDDWDHQVARHFDDFVEAQALGLEHPDEGAERGGMDQGIDRGVGPDDRPFSRPELGRAIP